MTSNAKPKPPADFDENPEWSEADFARATPFNEAFPEHHATWKAKGGRPKSEAPKVQIGLRLSPDIVAAVRATGPNYNARVERVLREALEKGQI